MKTETVRGVTFVQPQTEAERLLLEAARRKGTIDPGMEHRRLVRKVNKRLHSQGGNA